MSDWREEQKKKVEEAFKKYLTKNVKFLARKLSLPEKFVRETLDEIDEVQRTRKQKIPKSEKGHFFAPPFFECQMDLMDYTALSGSNLGFGWLLNVIDIGSRLAWVYPLKNKGAEEVERGLKEFIKDRFIILDKGQKDLIRINSPYLKEFIKGDKLTVPLPQMIQADEGKEFNNAKVKDLLKSFNIFLKFAEKGDHKKQSIVERFNKTVADKILLIQLSTGKKKYVDQIREIRKGYNDVKLEEGIQFVQVGDKKDRLPIGSKVKYRLTRGLFDKRVPVWSDESYEIIKYEGLRYVLKVGDKLRKFRREDVLPVREVREKKKEVNLVEDKKERKKERELKRLDINKANIIDGKRERIKKTRED